VHLSWQRNPFGIVYPPCFFFLTAFFLAGAAVMNLFWAS